MKSDEPYNFDLHDILDAAIAEAEQIDPLTQEKVNVMSRVHIMMSTQEHKFQISNKFLFIHNNNHIYYFDIN